MKRCYLTLNRDEENETIFYLPFQTLKAGREKSRRDYGKVKEMFGSLCQMV